MDDSQPNIHVTTLKEAVEEAWTRIDQYDERSDIYGGGATLYHAQCCVGALRSLLAAIEADRAEAEALLLDVWDSQHREGWEPTETEQSVIDRLGDWRWNNGYDPCNPPLRADPRTFHGLPAEHPSRARREEARLVAVDAAARALFRTLDHVAPGWRDETCVVNEDSDEVNVAWCELEHALGLDVSRHGDEPGASSAPRIRGEEVSRDPSR